MARKTTTTTVVYSDKDSDGNWRERTRSVTTVVEHDDEGYPYGPFSPGAFSWPYRYGRTAAFDHLSQYYSDIGASPLVKRSMREGKDG